jgi:hypothetical protein
VIAALDVWGRELSQDCHSDMLGTFENLFLALSQPLVFYYLFVHDDLFRSSTAQPSTGGQNATIRHRLRPDRNKQVGLDAAEPA